MNTTANSFFIVDCSKGLSTALPRAGAGELSRVILHTIGATGESLEQAARRLLRLAELAHGARDTDALRELSLALQAIPLESAQRAATYYGALVMKRAGLLDTAAAMLETLDAPRAIQTLGTIHEAQGDHAEAARLYTEALRRACDVDGLVIVNAAIQLSSLKSQAGDHHAALLDLENVWPMVRTLARRWPHLFYQLHNEMAVELAAVGQLDAARRAVAVAVASPIAEAYPEWQETRAELERVAVAVAVPIRKPRVKAQPATPGRARWPMVSGRWSLVSGRLSVVSCQSQARAPGVIERVKRCARDRDGPFVNVK